TARIFMTYGPAQKDLGKLVPYAILSLLRGERPNISSGKRDIDWIYVDDVVDGLLLMAATPNLEGAIMGLGSGTLTSVRDLVAQITSIIDPSLAPNFGAVPDRPLERIRLAQIQSPYE